MITFDLNRQPTTDPTSVYRYRDGLYAADLLIAAVAHLDFFSWLADHPSDKPAVCRGLGLQERPADVMLTLFTAMGLLNLEHDIFHLTEMAREHLVKTSPWYLGPYYASVKDRPVCRDMVTVLRTGKPANWSSLEHEKEWAKAMEGETFAHQFTAAMDCRGVYLGQGMARRLDCRQHRHLLDIAGGSGIYACALVSAHPHLRATVLEKPPVDRLTRETLAARGFEDRVAVSVGDMFVDPFPGECDVALFSNVLHDWDEPLVRRLLAKSFAALPEGGLIVIHDAHINAAKTGPLPVAAYSAMLMTITEGKCYSVREMEDFLSQAGFSDVNHLPTAADRSIMTARKTP
ncbi:MAG: methyltransferase [Limisphaerales bacterium]